MIELEDRLRALGEPRRQLDEAELRERVSAHRRRRTTAVGVGAGLLCVGAIVGSLTIDTSNSSISSVELTPGETVDDIAGAVPVASSETDQGGSTAPTPVNANTVVPATGSDATPATDSIPNSAATTVSTPVTSQTVSSVPAIEPPVTSAVSPGVSGLLVDQATLPDGWEAVTAMRSETPPLDPAGSFGRLVLGRYSADRSDIDGTIIAEVVQATPERLAEREGRTGASVLVQGQQALLTERDLSWVNVDRLYTVTSRARTAASREDLLAIANGLIDDRSGQLDATVVPDGFDFVASDAGRSTDQGVVWQTAYSSAATIDTDKPDLILDIVMEPAETAEVMLADSQSAVAQDLEGRRVIIKRPRWNTDAVHMWWDLPGGARAGAWYDPIVPPLTVDELMAEATRLVAAVRVANEDEWSTLVADAATAAETRGARPWIAAGLAERGLVAAGPTKEAVGLSVKGVLVPAGPVAADPTQTCEFLLTELVTCTPRDPSQWPTTPLTATIIDGRFVRVVTTTDAALVSVGSDTAHWYQPPITLFDDLGSPAVAYLDLQSELDAVCVEARSRDETVLAVTPLDGYTAASACIGQRL